MEKIELDVPKYSCFWNDGKGIDEAIYEIVNKYQRLEKAYEELKKSNSELRSEHYKDEELQRLKEKNETLQNRLNDSFTISEDERKAINKWQDEHKCKHRNNIISGISRYIFDIIPGIGYNGYVECSCGKKFCFYEE